MRAKCYLIYPGGKQNITELPASDRLVLYFMHYKNIHILYGYILYSSFGFTVYSSKTTDHFHRKTWKHAI